MYETPHYEIEADGAIVRNVGVIYITPNPTDDPVLFTNRDGSGKVLLEDGYEISCAARGRRFIRMTGPIVIRKDGPWTKISGNNLFTQGG